MTMKQHNEHCERIVDRMIEYYNGNIYEYDGYEYNYKFVKEDENGEYFETEDNEMVYLEDMEQLSLYDYFNDFLDVDYIVNCRKEYRAARIMVTCGSPNIYINTWDKQVELYWWTDEGKAYIPSYLNDAINDIFEDYYNTL